jgi:hypothetical protein
MITRSQRGPKCLIPKFLIIIIYFVSKIQPNNIKLNVHTL